MHLEAPAFAEPEAHESRRILLAKLGLRYVEMTIRGQTNVTDWSWEHPKGQALYNNVTTVKIDRNGVGAGYVISVCGKVRFGDVEMLLNRRFKQLYTISNGMAYLLTTPAADPSVSLVYRSVADLQSVPRNKIVLFPDTVLGSDEEEDDAVAVAVPAQEYSFLHEPELRDPEGMVDIEELEEFLEWFMNNENVDDVEFTNEDRMEIFKGVYGMSETELADIADMLPELD
jgi:hypothetical protein